MRGCACRGDSAGFVHLECLTQLAMSKEESGDGETVFAAWDKCGNCKQRFQGALNLEMKRRFWRQHRSSQDQDLLDYNSMKALAASLGDSHEFDATNQLLDEASISAGSTDALLDLKLFRTELLKKNGQKLEALGLLQAMLPEAKARTANPWIYGQTMLQIAEVLLGLGRYQDAYEAAAELVAITKARYGRENPMTLTAMRQYAGACMKLGRVEEAKATFEDVVTTQTRVLGRDHRNTQVTWEHMRFYGVAALFSAAR